MERLASGRASVVYAIDDRTVLRRTDFDSTTEARLMRYLRERGYPVPEVYESDGGDIRMERLHGPTLADELVNGRVGPEACAELIRGLHDDLHRTDPPPWIATRARGIDLTGGAADRAVLHLDLHPENILLTEHGPSVIDWTNAAAGDPEIDRAVTWTVFAGVDAATLGPALASGLDRLLDPMCDDLSREALATGLQFREADRNLDAAELNRVRARFAQSVPDHAEVQARIAGEAPVEAPAEEHTAYIEPPR
jgi:tRNA A-37 threonylcarbamoyl transferase component Bud32